MKNIEAKYVTELEAIKKDIQASEELSTYLEEEGEEEYKALITKFEGRIHELYEEVAKNNPLQLMDFETTLLDDEFEGLYLSKVLGYIVLRGHKNESYKYVRPQDHFKTVLNFILNSSNFDQIKLRVGQSIQIGFALSSDIWITNIINSVSNKRVKAFLESQNLLKYHDERNRRTGFVRYGKQFQSLNFYTALFPEEKSEFIREFQLLKSFLVYRSKNHVGENSSFETEINNLILNNSNFLEVPSYLELLIILGLYYDLNDEVKAKYSQIINDFRKSDPIFEEKYFNLLGKLWSELKPTKEEELRMTTIIDTSVPDKISHYHKTLHSIHTNGYMNEDAIIAVREFYYANEGLSMQNSCIRNTILKYYNDLLNNLEIGDYNDYFEVSKTISQYMNIFDNQQFNQDIKDTSLRYIKKLLRAYTDKRGKDYQDIKRFVWASFQDANFMSEKQLKEFFKTKRKIKPTA